MPTPTVLYNVRGGRGGTANARTNVLRFNPTLLLENLETYIRQTVGHEVAHLIARARFGSTISSHGKEWGSVMGWLGLAAERCHGYDLSSVVPGGETYACACRTYVLSKAKHAKVAAGRATYFCKQCKAPAVLVRAPGAVEPVAARRAILPLAPARAAKANASDPRSGPASRLPTPAMLEYAKSLAQKKGLPLPLAVFTESGACSAFITQAKAASDPVVAPPSMAQLEYARVLALRTRDPVPLHVLRSRQLLSAWISAHTG